MSMYFCFEVGFDFEENDNGNDDLQNGEWKNERQFRHCEESDEEEAAFDHYRDEEQPSQWLLIYFHLNDIIITLFSFYPWKNT